MLLARPEDVTRIINKFPLLCVFTVQRDSVSHLAQLEHAAADCKVTRTLTHYVFGLVSWKRILNLGPRFWHKFTANCNNCSVQERFMFRLFFWSKKETMATVLHVMSCQDEFRQQQIAMLWRASGATHTQVTRTHTSNAKGKAHTQN